KETQQHEAPAHGAPLPGPEPHASCVPMRVKLQPGEISKLSFSGGVAVGNARSTEWEGAFLSRRPEGTWTEIEGRRPGAPARHAATVAPSAGAGGWGRTTAGTGSGPSNGPAVQRCPQRPHSPSSHRPPWWASSEVTSAEPHRSQAARWVGMADARRMP